MMMMMMMMMMIINNNSVNFFGVCRQHENILQENTPERK
jgi:hypothetical protein